MRNIKKLSSFPFIFSLWLNPVHSQDPSFILTAKSIDNYIPASIGNGYFSIESSLFCTNQTGSYMARMYDHAAGDVPRIARLPAWNEINYFDGDKWLNSEKFNNQNFSNYEQTLDMFNGTLKTEYTWQDDKKSTLIITEVWLK